eukprot:CAMPEP_0174722678 /NCGR_PEP_ID=MMETSP1094-20130205/39020_1 /TAXON_ID=156173 /ORGANISM="Chrysochromulina brevifilum, Strain UTEX LB 985" /LENGTH=240 /DNA_ID=CAMNT_0015923577 /DNA_START=42 /DNA_END=761 /DNA_ORIENTATION=-
MVLHTNNHTPGQPGADSSSNAPPALHTSGPQFGPDSLSSAPPALLLTSLAFAQQRKQQSTHAEERRVRFSGTIIRYEIPRRQYVDIVGDWRSGNNWCLIAIKRTARLEAFAEEVLLSKVFGALRLAASSHETDAGDPWDGHQTSAKVTSGFSTALQGAASMRSQCYAGSRACLAASLSLGIQQRRSCYTPLQTPSSGSSRRLHPRDSVQPELRCVHDTTIVGTTSKHETTAQAALPLCLR